ncbi:hypothetical protein BJV78DRAFT_1361617 [Lactifluus subvellereus]|nr:hypothetical protein BJV78DRAFT_1361617 [Lactifluus subvellereus]
MSQWKALGLIALLTVAMTLRRRSFTRIVTRNSGETLGNEYDQDEFTERAAEWLGGAVRIPTETYDEMGPIGVDERWEIFGQFHDHLAESFPLTHETLTPTKVNTYGLLYEWKGSDVSLKPLF